METCPRHHKRLVARPVPGQTQEQRFCGTWYDCPIPGCQQKSVLIPSKALLAQLKSMKKGG